MIVPGQWCWGKYVYIVYYIITHQNIRPVISHWVKLFKPSNDNNQPTPFRGKLWTKQIMITWTCFRRLEKRKIFPNWWFNGDFTAVESTKPPQTNKRQVISSHHWSHMIHLSNHFKYSWDWFCCHPSRTRTFCSWLCICRYFTRNNIHPLCMPSTRSGPVTDRYKMEWHGAPINGRKIDGFPWGYFTPLTGVLGPYWQLEPWAYLQTIVSNGPWKLNNCQTWQLS